MTGRLVLNDPQKPGASTANLLVGLTHPAYASPVTRAGASGPGRPIDWQTDAKHYEFWARGDDHGGFTIPNVRAGSYTLHAFADGVLGEYAKTGITVEPGKLLDLGELPWTPVRHGKPLWEVGIPNRNGSEFFKGDESADPSISLEYAKLFPDDVNYAIGKSDFRKDWFFQHVPHNEDPTPGRSPSPASAVTAGRHPTRSLSTSKTGRTARRRFDSPSAARALGMIEVDVNGRSAGRVDRLISDGAITRHSSQGIWYERELPFDASLLRQGTNVLKLTVPAGPINNGVIYDYLRLELDDSIAPPAASATATPTLFIAGDSTVRAGRGVGGNGLFGWGDPIEESLDRSKISVVNRAVGGTGADTFIALGYWDHVLAVLKPRDVVIMQFDHNEIGVRGALRGTGEEARGRENPITKQTETVHTFGWYMRKYIADSRARRATPIVCSLIPRNI